MAKTDAYEILGFGSAVDEETVTAICDQMQPDQWAVDNEMTSYQPANLKKFLSNEQNLIVLSKEDEKITGIAICYILPHPAGDDSLYVHELDTHPDYRRQGIATRIMRKIEEIAEKYNLKEVWVGTETDNVANKFYRSLQPDEICPSVIYSFEVKHG
jgi:ribosomal protein S18 acetylase RimI-like enzyme